VRKRGECGVTLIELVIVMAIIAVIGFCMAPAIGEWLDNFRIRQAAKEIASTLQLAKIKAIASRLEYNVVFDVAEESYQLMRNDPTTGWTPEGTECGVHPSVDIDTNLTSHTCQFNPDGTSSNGTITINNDQGKTHKVVVYRTGRIKIL
jgi:general secretion pathway protein H